MVVKKYVKTLKIPQTLWQQGLYAKILKLSQA